MTNKKTVKVILKGGSMQEYTVYHDKGSSLSPFYSGDIEVYEDVLSGDVVIKEYQASRDNIGCDWAVDKDKMTRITGGDIEKIVVKDDILSHEREIIPSGVLKRID